ncbi:MAG: hypothetical protein DRJ05_04085 [Bacteroidetes bacterium]|nr:MAG: hypothetical protein DRJ05_04085 [Bacteroidota bacterium]
MQKFSYILIFLLILVSCEEIIDWDYEENPPLLMVVDGKITDQAKAHKIRLTKPVSELNDIPEPITGAEVSILFKQGNDTIENPLTEALDEPGTYLTDSSFQGITYKYYALQIKHEGYEFLAIDNLRESVPFETANIYTQADNGLYNVNFIYGAFANADAAIWYFNLDWSHLPDTVYAPNGTKKARLAFYSLPSIDVNGLFLSGYETVYFPAGTKIILEKYSISESYAEFLRTMLAETDWRGGVFDTYRANTFTNLSDGATGFFGACGYLADTVVVQP